MAKWTEVDIYTGLVKKVDEDAPVNFAGQGSKVALPPDVMMKKKKKIIIHLQEMKLIWNTVKSFLIIQINLKKMKVLGEEEKQQNILKV